MPDYNTLSEKEKEIGWREDHRHWYIILHPICRTTIYVKKGTLEAFYCNYFSARAIPLHKGKVLLKELAEKSKDFKEEEQPQDARFYALRMYRISLIDFANEVKEFESKYSNE